MHSNVRGIGLRIGCVEFAASGLKTSDFFVFMSSIVEDYRIDGPPKLQRRSSIWNRKCGQRMRLGGNVTNVGCGRLCVICRDT